MRSHILPAVIVASSFLVGCDDPPPPDPTELVSRADSAGIEIVVSHHGPDDVPVLASLPDEPFLRLGTMDGEPATQFASINEVIPMVDGGVVVAEGQTRELRRFGPDGAHRSTAGGLGQGPGELQSISTAGAWSADSVMVWDWQASRLTVFPAEGGEPRMVPVEAEGSERPYALLSSDAGGPLLGRLRWIPPGGGSGPPEGEPTLVRDSAVYGWFGRDGTPGDTVAVMATGEMIRLVTTNGPVVRVLGISAVAGRDAVAARARAGAWLGISDHFELTLYDETGRPVRIVRAPGLERLLDPADVAAEKERRLAEAETPEQRVQVQTIFDTSPIPTHWPAFARLLVDDRDRLWLSQYSFGQPETRTWWVFAADGALVGRVEVPGEISVEAVAFEKLFGVVRDELDVPYVVVYPLEWSTT